MVMTGRLRALAGRSKRQVMEGVQELPGRVATPSFLRKQVDGATRTGQVMAVVFLPVVIMVSLVLIVAFNNVLAGVFGGWDPLTPQAGMFGFIVTLMTLGMVLLAGWGWFQFVRTSGFGLFEWGE